MDVFSAQGRWSVPLRAIASGARPPLGAARLALAGIFTSQLGPASSTTRATLATRFIVSAICRFAVGMTLLHRQLSMGSGLV
jgi:hypothetical protein